MVYHPDKNTINDLEKCEKIYKSIQDAYNTLMDEKKRKTYDSSIPFDDSIPDPHDPRDFFELYGPVFARNSIWSVRQPTPPLGDDKSEGKLVDRFYDFWLSFKSWREFPNEEQYDLEEAESRDERRWMDRMNQKIQAQAKREESSRIRTLVEQAMESDPRIQRIRKAKEDERLAKKRAKEEIKRKAMEEEERRKLEKIQAEERRIAQELALKEKAKKDKEVQKKNLKKLRKKIRQMLTEDSAISVSR